MGLDGDAPPGRPPSSGPEDDDPPAVGRAFLPRRVGVDIEDDVQAVVGSDGLEVAPEGHLARFYDTTERLAGADAQVETRVAPEHELSVRQACARGQGTG